MIDGEPGKKLKILFKKYYQNEASSEEEAELMSALQVLSEEKIAEILETLWDEESGEEIVFDKRARQNIFKRIEKKINPIRRMYWGVAAAIALMALGISLYVSLNNPMHRGFPEQVTIEKIDDSIKPGTNAATFISSDGKRIDLTRLADGETKSNLEGAIRKSGDNLIVYHPNKAGAAAPSNSASSNWNVLRTPYGGQFQLSLPDGSKVWLNANSSIEFPSVFNRHSREVRVSGEVYFEVSHDPEHPFLVKLGDTEVEVLGTSFNVSRYSSDQNTVTTLIDGVVNVRKGAQSATLKPGEQAITGRDVPLKVGGVKNLSTAIGWKDGVFVFDDTDITSIMKQISRWYNVEIEFPGEVPKKKLTGSIDRSVALSQILEMLAYSGLRFEIVNKKIRVWEHQKPI
ncbi:MAG: FecR family protein [Sphingobacterium sp.]